MKQPVKPSVRKLDTGKAWTEATVMLKSNRETVLAVAGLFFFLPYFAISLIFPAAMTSADESVPTDPENSDAMLQAILDAQMALYADYWWAFLLLALLQAVGMLALLKMLRDQSRPTLGEALKTGFSSTPSYIATQILQVLFAMVVVGIPVALLSFISPILGIFLVIPLVAYLFTKFLLAAPVIAVEGTLNPITALSRSWTLTKKNSLNLFLFMFLLIIAIGVLSIVVSLIFGVVFAALGPSVETIGNNAITSLVNAVISTVTLAVLAAVHRQLSAPAPTTSVPPTA